MFGICWIKLCGQIVNLNDLYLGLSTEAIISILVMSSTPANLACSNKSLYCLSLWLLLNLILLKEITFSWGDKGM